MPDAKIPNHQIFVYPIVDAEPGNVIQYRWKLVYADLDGEDEAVCIDPVPYGTPEQAYLAALKTRWIMGSEGLPMVLVNEEGKALPQSDQNKMREEATLLLRQLQKTEDTHG